MQKPDSIQSSYLQIIFGFGWPSQAEKNNAGGAKSFGSHRTNPVPYATHNIPYPPNPASDAIYLWRGPALKYFKELYLW
jgi:hypothetical protein